MPASLRIAVCTALLVATAVVHAGERLIHREPSVYNGTLLVSEDSRGLRVLRFSEGGARQSVVKPGDPDHLELAYTRAFPVTLAWVPQPRRILVVGLGGGSIPRFLHHRLPEATIDAVELDPGVVKLARELFDVQEDDRLRLHVADGRAWIERASQRYDLVVLDAYGASAPPPALITREFLASVRSLLTDQGLVVGNLWNRNYNPRYDDMVTTYLDIFGEVSILALEGVGNTLVISGPASTRHDRDELLHRAGKVGRDLGRGPALEHVLRTGLRGANDRERAGQILTDKGLRLSQ